MADFPFVTPVEVRFRDVDGLGHVNNAVYMTYFEQARIGYGMQLLGANSLAEVPFILAEATVSYHRPVYFGDDLLVHVRVSHIGTKSFSMAYELRRGEELVATCRSVQVWYDYAALRSVAVPATFRAAVGATQSDAPMSQIEPPPAS